MQSHPIANLEEIIGQVDDEFDSIEKEEMMSQWTHVNCSIRFDGIAGLTPTPNLGNTVSFEDDEPKWSLCDVPKGSEGSLNTNLLVSNDPRNVARYVASIWGDLRDYDNPTLIIAYLNRITEGHMIRSGVAEISVERAESLIVKYDLEAEAWERVAEWKTPS